MVIRTTIPVIEDAVVHEVLALQERLGDSIGQAHMLYNLADLMWLQGRSTRSGRHSKLPAS